MLKLRRRAPEFVTVDLGAGATARVRPATAIDVDRASAFVQQTLKSAMALGEDGLALIALTLGEEGKVIDLNAVAMAECAMRLSVAKLSEICTASWSGVCDEDGTALAVNLSNMLLLQRDSMLRAKFTEVINRAVHEEAAEKNVSAASPNGAAATDEATAPAAAKAESPAPLGSAEQAASSAPNESMRH